MGKKEPLKKKSGVATTVNTSVRVGRVGDAAAKHSPTAPNSRPTRVETSTTPGRADAGSHPMSTARPPTASAEMAARVPPQSTSPAASSAMVMGVVRTVCITFCWMRWKAPHEHSKSAWNIPMPTTRPGVTKAE